MPFYNTSFEPQHNGFRFANLFGFSLAFDVPLLGAVDLGSFTYGLCGGMCFAALDYWHAGRPAAGASFVGLVPGLYAWIWKRQVDSLALPKGPLRLYEAMRRTDEDLLARALGREQARIMRRLVRAEPAVLLLVRGAGMGALTSNHLVLAYRAEQTADRLRLWLYDPNYPGHSPTMTISSRGIAHSTGERDRGLYVVDYQPRRRGLPPASPDM